MSPQWILPRAAGIRDLVRPQGGSRLRVTHVINRFGLSGGAENQLTMNLSHFDDDSIHHEVVALYHDDEDEESALPQIDKTFLFGDADQPGRLRILRDLRRQLRQRPPDLIHCSLADAALASRVIGRLDGFPVLESLVNVSHEPVRVIDNPAVRPWKLAAHRWADRLTMRSVSHFHALTHAVARSWIEHVGLDPASVTVIPRGVDLGRFDLDSGLGRRRVRHELGLADDDVMILNVGRQEAQKGQRYLLEALPEIIAGERRAILVMAGRQGNASASLRELIRSLSLEPHVRMIGVRSDIPDLLAACDVFVFPSLFEGLGVSLLEAMAARRPCVVSDAGPFDEIVDDGHSGLMARVADPADIAAKVLAVIRTEGLSEALSHNARARVEAEFEISQVAARTQDLYRRLAEQAASSNRK